MKEPNISYIAMGCGAVLSLIFNYATKEKIPKEALNAINYLIYGFVAFIIIKKIISSDLTSIQEKIFSFLLGWAFLVVVISKFTSNK